MRISILLILCLYGCSSTSTVNQVGSVEIQQPADVVAIERNPIPQVWSDHKVLDVSEEVCAQKAADALTALGFSGVVTSGTYVYGNYINNRAAVKCTPIDEGTFVYAIVAGSDVKTVERLRNEIVWKL